MPVTPDVIRIDPASLRRLYDTAQTARDAFTRAFVQAHPVGSAVSWERQGVQHGKVVTVAQDTGALEVENDETGARYWVAPRYVMDAQGAGS